MGAAFVKYRPMIGSWMSKVNNFSKYGWSDSDDENEGDKLPEQAAKDTDEEDKAEGESLEFSVQNNVSPSIIWDLPVIKIK